MALSVKVPLARYCSVSIVLQKERSGFGPIFQECGLECIGAYRNVYFHDSFSPVAILCCQLRSAFTYWHYINRRQLSQLTYLNWQLPG